MKIGIFDSGIGGLIIFKAITKKLPEYDYLYLGDTKRVPYGNRSQQTIYEFTEQALTYLFNHDCKLVIIACNTASTEALRKIQQQFIPAKYPNRKVLGVVVPTIEQISQNSPDKVGVIATAATVASDVFVKEARKVNPNITVYQESAPLLVPLIENGFTKFSKPVLAEYLKPLLKKKVSVLVLGCTHYALLKKEVKKIMGKNVAVISQDEFIPQKLQAYLLTHPEITKTLSKHGRKNILLTDSTAEIIRLSKRWFSKNIVIKIVIL